MEIIKVDLANPEKAVVEKIVEDLKKGKVVALPFDTSYGLAADAANDSAVEHLFEVKGREEGKAVSIAVRDYAMLEGVASVANEEIRKFILKYLPGKVTVVLNSKYQIPNNKFQKISNLKSQISNLLFGKDGTVGVRIVESKLISDVLWGFGKPITATSANVAGQPAAYSADEIIKQFEGREFQPDLIVDGGILEQTSSSTVVLATVWPPLVLRQGAVEIKEAE
jgi:L-threonylcarbamoyladenylate synthase